MRTVYAIMLVIGIIMTGCNICPKNGVGQDLAIQRAKNIDNVSYRLHFSIPSSCNCEILAKESVSFNLKDRGYDVVLDFRALGQNHIPANVNGKGCNLLIENGHIIVPHSYLIEGANTVDIEFVAGDMSLNRKPEFLYSLLVPDRASTVFPCFDQPNMKAVFNLSLSIPNGWVAVANGEEQSVEVSDSSTLYTFAETRPISTYLFAFAAGIFRVDSLTEGDRTIKIFYRETDDAKVKRNLDAIYSTHFHALRWLEGYTAIAYPFGKLDVVLIPDFQYGGMEHAGCIFYNESSLLLDNNPSVTQRLNQANLIAHEVSHQWFGNLVTMSWFNEVWLKEVFAGLMADKVVNPQYPEVDHNLRFLLSHFPQAYSVDRTAGSNAIDQDLENLLFAGTLYGDIIYHKAPIAFDQLETLLGSDSFRRGLQKYLAYNYMSNANFQNLVQILDSLTPADLEQWSRQWIYGKGIPQIVVSFSDSGLSLCNSNLDALLPMQYGVSANGFENGVNQTSQCYVIDNVDETCHDLLLNSNGKAYGVFDLPAEYIDSMLVCSKPARCDVSRAAWYINANELFLQGKIGTTAYFTYLVNSLKQEKNPQIMGYLRGNIEKVYWRFMSNTARGAKAGLLEELLCEIAQDKNIAQSERKQTFSMFCRVALTPESIEFMHKVWSQDIGIDGVELAEQDYVNMAYELAIRSIPQADSILRAQELQIKNPDRLSKFKFVSRAVTPNDTVRINFARSLAEVQNRRPEPWVSDALRYFNHPLRAGFALDYLSDMLDLLPDVQRTGDIFFPKMWLDALLWGHSSQKALNIVDSWMGKNPQIPLNLKNKLLQSSDNLNRAVLVVNKK